MPNHIKSAIEIKGPKDKLEKLIKDTELVLDTAIRDHNKFDFNGIIKMPEELMSESSGGDEIGMMALSQSHYDKAPSKGYPWFPSRYPGVVDSETLKAFLEQTEEGKREIEAGQRALDNMEKYGHKDWYSWSIENWGTKWNAYDVKYISHDDNHLALEITTAWDTPRTIWAALEEMGFEVNGIVYGEMEGTDTIGDGGPFYTEISVEFDGFTDYEEQ